MARRTTKKSSSRKSTARRGAAKRSTSAARKSTARKSSARKGAARKTTARKGAKRAGSTSRKRGSSTGRSFGSRLRGALSMGSGEPKQLDDLFHEALKDTYMAEKQILKALPKMAKAAQSAQLRQAFEKHERETRTQVERLEGVFRIIGKRAQTKHCPAIEGIIEEGEEIMSEFKGSDALDAGLIAAAQAVEHYEITRYGTLKAWAQQLGHFDAVRLIDETLTEEKNTDQTLTGLAEGSINPRAEAA